MRGYIALISVVVLAACYHGPSISTFPPVQEPYGVDADLRLRGARVHGELLEVMDSTLILLTDADKIVAVPVSVIQVGTFDKLGQLIVEGIKPEPGLARLRPFSRYPAGLTPELWARLLGAYGQTEPQVIR
jgi:hypothetical protein